MEVKIKQAENVIKELTSQAASKKEKVLKFRAGDVFEKYVRDLKAEIMNVPFCAKRFDYGSCAFYFITICTKSRIPYFGEIVYENGDDLSIPEPRCARNPPTVGPHNPPTVCACNPPTVGACNPPTVGPRNCAHLPLGNVEFNQPRKKMVLTEIGRIAFNYWKKFC
jgi:hypothetical protein